MSKNIFPPQFWCNQSRILCLESNYKCHYFIIPDQIQQEMFRWKTRKIKWVSSGNGFNQSKVDYQYYIQANKMRAIHFIRWTKVGGNTDNVTLFLECNLKLASTTEFHVECNSLHYNETAKHCGVTSLLPAGC